MSIEIGGASGMSTTDLIAMNTAALDRVGRVLDEPGAPISEFGGAGGGGGGGSKRAGSGNGDTAPTQDAEKTADTFLQSITQSLRDAMVNGDFKSFLTSIMDNLTNRIIDTFTNSLMEGLFGGIGFDKMFEDWGTMLSNQISGALNQSLSGAGGAGGWMSTAFSFVKGIFGFGFAEGGLVPHTPYSKIGRDSVPAMLTPGEVVVPVDQVQNGFGRGMTTVNLNITGDISRQTRKTIYEMLPDIANGVNAVNYEAGAR